MKRDLTCRVAGFAQPANEKSHGLEQSEHDSGSGVSYRDSLRATAITGFTNLSTLAVTLIKSKVIALRVGPEGIGLFGVLTAATGLISNICGFGMISSGVRQVATASATGDPHDIARVVYTLRRTTFLSGLLGTLIVLLFAAPIARVTTGSDQYTWLLFLLAPLILFRNVYSGQTALLRGLRRIGDLARLRIIGALAATAFAVPLVWIWGLNGVAPAMLMTSVCSLAASWWYARRIRMPTIALKWSNVWREAEVLFSLGFAFLLTGLQEPVVQNVLRAILVHYSDLYTVGQFLAAMALSHTYVSFILKAMGLDFLPRLSRQKDDIHECNRLVNEQVEIALLLAIPGVTALVVFAPLLIPLFYSTRFEQAIGVFQWQCLGILLKVASWPLRFVLVAQARRSAFVITETLTNIVYVGAFFLLVQRFGLTGAALSFVVVYLIYVPFISVTIRRFTGFRWSVRARRTFVTGLGAYSVALFSHQFLLGEWRWLLGLILVTGVVLWSYRELCQRIEVPLVGRAWAKLRGSWSPRSKCAIEP